MYYLSFSGTTVFRKIMQHIFFQEVSIFNKRLINNISCFKLNLFDLKLKILNSDWRQEIVAIAFKKKSFTWHTQNIIWEMFKVLEYFLDISPFFHEHFALITHSFVSTKIWKFYTNLMRQPVRHLFSHLVIFFC